MKNEPFPHTIIYSGSGMGKTSLVHAIAKSMGVKIVEVKCSGNITNLDAIMLKATPNMILLLDEVHAAPMSMIEGFLYNLMDNGELYIKYPDGNIRTFRLLNQISIIGTTTEVDKIPIPLMNRFTLQLKLKNYTHDQMINILKLYLKSLTISDDAYEVLANVTRYIPRMAVQYSTQILNYALQYNLKSLNKSNIINALSSWGIDQYGLTDDDREYLSLIFNTFNNAPVGIKQLCAMLDDSERSIVARENYMVREGYLVRTSRGRMLTPEGLLIAMSLPDPNGDST